MCSDGHVEQGECGTTWGTTLCRGEDRKALLDNASFRPLSRSDGSEGVVLGGEGGRPAPALWVFSGLAAGTPLPGDRPMVAPEDTTADALPQKRYRND